MAQSPRMNQVGGARRAPHPMVLEIELQRKLQLSRVIGIVYGRCDLTEIHGVQEIQAARQREIRSVGQVECLNAKLEPLALRDGKRFEQREIQAVEARA